MENINEYYFHDKTVENICINSNKDFMDEIIIYICDEGGTHFEIKCIDCVVCNVIGNGWIAGKDTIRYCILKKGDEVKNLIPSFIDESHRYNFKYLKLNLNTSNSCFDIVAKEIFLVSM